MKNTTNTNLQNKSTELLNIQLEKLQLKNTEILTLNSLVTIYLDECYKYIESNRNEKKYNSLVNEFKSKLLDSINDTDKLTNITFTVFNRVMKKTNLKLLVKLRLLDFTTIKKYSLLNKNYTTKLNFDLSKDDLIENINELYKEMMDNKNEISFNKKATTKGYKKI